VTTASTNNADRRRRCLSSTTYDFNEQQRCPTTMIEDHGIDNGTPGVRDVATLDAVTYQVSRQLSTSSTTVDIHFRLDKLLIISIFQQIVDKMRIKLYFLTIKSTGYVTRRRQSYSTLVHDVNTTTSRDKVQT